MLVQLRQQPHRVLGSRKFWVATMPKSREVEAPDLAPAQAHQGYRPEKVGLYTGIPTRSIYLACARGEIRHTRIGRSIVIPGAEVLRLLGASA